MLRSEPQPKPTGTATLSDPSDHGGLPNPSRLDPSSLGTEDFGDSTTAMTSTLSDLSDDACSLVSKRLEPSSLATRDSGNTSSKQQSEPTPALSDPSDEGYGSPNPKRMRLDPSFFEIKDSLDKSLAVSSLLQTKPLASHSVTDNAATSPGTRSDQASLSREDSTIKNSIHELCSGGNLVNRMTPATDIYFTNDSARTPQLDPVSDKDSSSRHGGRSSDSDSVSVGSKLATSVGDSLILVSDVTVRKADLSVKLEMVWVDGMNRELMHQLMQFFKNRLL